MKGIQYEGIIRASLLLKRPQANFYVTNLTDSWVPFTAVIEMPALVDRRHFGGNCLVYLPKYVDPAPMNFSSTSLSDKQSAGSPVNGTLNVNETAQLAELSAPRLLAESSRRTFNTTK